MFFGRGSFKKDCAQYLRRSLTSFDTLSLPLFRFVRNSDIFEEHEKQKFKLSFPKLETGIVECLWTIEAVDKLDAIKKFSEYLSN